MKEDFTKDPYLTYTLSEILGVRLISKDPSIFKTSAGGSMYYAAYDPRWHYGLSSMNHLTYRRNFAVSHQCRRTKRQTRTGVIKCSQHKFLVVRERCGSIIITARMPLAV